MLTIKTKMCCGVYDITSQVKAAISASEIVSGICVVSTRHTTTAILVNESEGGLMDDIQSIMSSTVSDNGYYHDLIDNNAPAHLKAMLVGSSSTLPIIGGELMLGTWQSVLFVEFDGPKTRTVDVSIVPSG